MVHVRRVNGRTLEFGVSGGLWNDALVMYDRQSGSLWSQVTGECNEERFEGQTLAMVPATVTTFGEWRQHHPETRVLAKPAGAGNASAYGEYAASGRQGIFGTWTRRGDLEPKEVVQGVVGEGEAVAFPHATLKPGVPVAFDLGRRPCVAVRVGRAVQIYERRAGERLLRLERLREGGALRLRDRGTGTVWDGAGGEGLRGPLAGFPLRPIPSTTAYWFAWVSFYPHTRVEKPSPRWVGGHRDGRRS